MRSAVYRLENLQVRYGNRLVLDVGHLEIGEGSILGLEGPNGSGKSTLLRVLAFLESPTAGSLLFMGVSASGCDPLALRRQVTLLLQDPYLLRTSVFENVAYGLRARGIREGIRERVFHSLELVGLDPASFAGRPWKSLSGGEARRVAMASRLAIRTPVLLLDEPTAGVDAESAVLLKSAALKAREEWGATLVVVSHDMAWMSQVADTLLAFQDGRPGRHVVHNRFDGPWSEQDGGLWSMSIGDGQSVVATKPPASGRTGFLDAEDITVAVRRPQGLSMRNAIRVTVLQMTLENGSGAVLLKGACGNRILTARLTRSSAAELGLVPGTEAWFLFKASAFQWE
ncbi:MAG: ATP-binding cassette domain-containing protein [Synergistaceae bacterium]|nr:ATP-binding cassette domain-containing protein [Synergistaceae bacterium]